jgi:8-oxo-dGTP pyrophosphatase MutT (NUDIX family)
VVTLPDGRKVWLSRSCAVVANIWYIGLDMRPHVLMGKRGPGCPDEIGKWVLPCGYLDYNETLAEAAAREVYEETGLDVQEIFQNDEYSTLWDNIHVGGQPYMVNSVPRDDTRQNITHYFGIVFSGQNPPELSNEHCEPGEVDDLKWVPYEEVSNFDIGFGHKRRIDAFYQERVK